MSFYQWTFDPDEPVSTTEEKSLSKSENDAMNYVLTFGKFKGCIFAQVMSTELGRQNLTWLKKLPCSDEQFIDAHNKSKERIETCFIICFLQCVDVWSNKKKKTDRSIVLFSLSLAASVINVFAVWDCLQFFWKHVVHVMVHVLEHARALAT